MNATQIVIDELKIPLKYIKESSKFDRVEALVHRTWLRHILTNWCVPEHFVLHEQLQPEEINAWFKQRENFGSNWQHVVIKVLEKSSTTVIPLPRTKVGAKPEAVLSYSQILHYVGQTNHKNIWKEAYKKYCHGSLPGIGEHKVQDSSRIQLTDGTTVLKEVIARAYCCPIISIDGTTPQIESDPKFETHPNLLPTNVVLETERYFLLLHEGSLSYTLQDCVSFSPAILSGSYAKPLFIIYQLLRLMRHLHDHGLALGDITLADIQLSQDLWIQVLPHLEANIYNIPKPVEKPVTTPVEVENSEDETSVDVGNLCAAWVQGAVSNFDYLSSLNKLAGRRYGDPRSHHVFPWITDFTSHSGANWRDLTKSKFRLNKGDRQLDLTYELPPNCNVAQVPHHVSDVLSEITYYVYLARVTPKPILCKYVRPQWVPAEYPSSIQRLQQWTPDECIPEFFTDPSVFKSIHPDLPNLELPNWASSVQDFVTRHRAALESSHVSERLHYWIDLTFGYKLSGIAAVKSKNVCLQLVDGHTQLTDIGVVQLFTQPHPQRIGPSIYWSITPPRLQHNLHRDRRKVCSDDEDGHSSGDEDESVTNISGNTPRSSPLGLSRLLSRSRNSLPTSSSLMPSSPSSEPSPSAANERSSSTSTCTIVLPHDYNPVAGLVALENLHNFIHKTSHVIYKGCENNSYSEITAFKQVVAARRVQEMQVLGCLIVEMFLATKLRVFGCGLQPIPFTQRLQICRTVLQTSSTNRDQIPRCVRSLVVLLLQIDVGSENESVQGTPFRYPTVTSFGIPPPSAHQLLQPNLTSNLLPFPSNFPIIYSMVKTLQEYSDVLAELRRVRLEKYPDGDVKGDMLTGVIEKLSEWKVKSIAQDLEKLVEDPMYGNTTIGWMDLVLPHILNMLLDPATSVVTAWHLFDPIARALGPSRSATLLLEPMVRLYDCESERDSVIPESLPHRLKKRIKIYHRSFLLRLMIRFRMKVFLDNFIPPLVEGVGGYQDIETSNSVENMEMRAEMRENTGLLDYSEVEEATEWTGESILSPLDEDSSADSDKNHSTVTTIPTVLGQDGAIAEPELFVLETEDSTEDDESEQSRHTKCKSIQSLLLDQLEIQTDEADDSSTSSNTKSPVVNIPCRNKSLDIDSDDSSWKRRSDDSLNCQYEERTKKNDLEYTKVSEVSVDSVTWLMHRLGPVLTARYLSRNLLRMLSLCYAGKGCQQRPGNDVSKLIGDDNAAKVLDCLASIAVVYGEQLIVLQYLPHMTDLIVLCKKKCTFNLEAGLVASLALLKHCTGYITDTTISDLLQDTLLKTIIHPCLRLLSSTRQLFPGGVAARLALATKLIECLYLLALRVNTEQRIVLVHTLQRFFLVFSKARGQKSEDLGVSRGSGGVETANVPRVRDYDSTDSCSPPQTNMAPGTDTDSTKSKALEELYQAMNPQLAYWTYTPFANFFGETFMEQSLKNYSLLQELCSVYIKEQEELGHPVIGDPFLSDTETSLPLSEDSVNVNAVVVGNRIDLQEPIVIKPSSPGIPICFSSCPSGQVLNKNMENNTRHLRGNWLAYWEHEIGRSGKDNHLNVKQIKLQSYSGHSNSVRVLTVLDNENSFLSASRDKTVKVWSLRSKGDGNTVSGCQWTYSGHRKSVMALGFVERVRLAVSCDSTVHLWDPFVGRAVSQTDMRYSPVNTLRPLNPPSAAVLTANTDSTLRTFDTRVGSYVNELKVVASGAGLIRCISVSPAGTLVALGQASGYLTVLDLRTGTVVSSWKGHEGEVLQLLAINEQTVVSSSLDQAVSAWNVTEGKLKFNLKGPTEPVHCLDSYSSELISGTTANRIGVHSGIDASASFSSTRLRTETFKGVLTALNVLPLNRLLLLGADTGGITLLC